MQEAEDNLELRLLEKLAKPEKYRFGSRLWLLASAFGLLPSGSWLLG